MHHNPFTLANALTVFRIALVPAYLVLFARQTWPATVAALLVFIVAALTDLIDGHVARSRQEVTKLGKFLDPLADKLLVIGALIQFWAMGLVNFWLVLIIVVRDVWVTAMRVDAIRKGTELKTSGDAKVKTTIQLVAIISTITFTGVRLIVLDAAAGYTGAWADITYYRIFFNVLVFVAAAFTVYSWIRYIVRGRIPAAGRN